MKINSQIQEFRTIEHAVELCVVGGGLAGMFAAIAAARRGTKVLLMQDRPVLGGNASSEIRMWVRGAHGSDNRESGLLEEIALENYYRNPDLNFSIWDSILYEKVRFEENITLLLNCSCCATEMADGRIIAVKGWQTTTQTWHLVRAHIFADCSGDSVLAPLTGAEVRIGRESRDEFGESIAPIESDNCTMGQTCLLQARELAHGVTFTPPKWANKYTKESFPFRINFENRASWTNDNFWWMELGGCDDSIADTETLRDALLKMAFGVWDFIKNSGTLDAANWDIEWIGFLPGKRESRRYVGDYMLTQNDVIAQGKFDDLIAYGGWSMDDHHPEGFLHPGYPTIHHQAPSPFGIPYRCIYSKNIKNLMFAGRNISATHAAMSATRVMATCAILGQALGTAAHIACAATGASTCASTSTATGVATGASTGAACDPRGVYESKVEVLQQMLMEDDCYLPFQQRRVSDLTRRAHITATQGDVAKLTNGIERTLDGVDHAWEGAPDDEIVMTFDTATTVRSIRIVFDSDFARATLNGVRQAHKTFPMACNIFLHDQAVFVPKMIVCAFEILGDTGDGTWKEVFREANNYQRLVKIKLNGTYKSLKLVPRETWGSERVRIFAVDIN